MPLLIVRCLCLRGVPKCLAIKERLKNCEQWRQCFGPQNWRRRKQRSALNIVPLLLKTQDQFINMLSVETRGPEHLFSVIEASTMSPNLFLKHLVILADYGGEMLQRVSAEKKATFSLCENNTPIA